MGTGSRVMGINPGASAATGYWDLGDFGLELQHGVRDCLQALERDFESCGTGRRRPE